MAHNPIRKTGAKNTAAAGTHMSLPLLLWTTPREVLHYRFPRGDFSVNNGRKSTGISDCHIFPDAPKDNAVVSYRVCCILS